VGKVVLRDREDVVMIAPKGDGIVLYKMRYPKEVRKIDDVPLVEKHKANKDELKLAKSLIDSMATTFNKMTLENTYNDAVREMVQAKIAGKEIIAIEEVEPEVVDIMTALKQSIEQAKGKKKPMEKVTAEKTVAKEKKSAKSKGAVAAKSKTKAKARKSA
jgi:DNA end-binding protein Ku